MQILFPGGSTTGVPAVLTQGGGVWGCSVMKWYGVVWRGGERVGHWHPGLREPVEEGGEPRDFLRRCGWLGFAGFAMRSGIWDNHKTAIVQQPDETR